jgi:hypothetical protein
MPHYPYDRFLSFPPERGFLALARRAWPVARIKTEWTSLKYRLWGWWHRNRYEPLVRFDPVSGQPVLTGVSDSVSSCRTRHSRAASEWRINRTRLMCDFSRARQVLTATGRRIETSYPRRPDPSGDGWIWGRFEITADDVVLIDDATRKPTYHPDAEPEATRLEKLLATSPRFRAAVANRDFAAVAFLMLTQLEWFNVREPDELPPLSGSTAGMIAGLRDRGEIYADYKFGVDIRGISQADIHRHSLELHAIMAELGWRTHTDEELRLKARADFDSRVAERITNWNSLAELEARAANTHDSTGLRYAEIPMSIYVGEEAWAAQLPQDVKLMVSEAYARRVRDLIATNRISRDEYRTLTGLFFC